MSNDYQQQKAMRNGKYKAFYLSERQHDKVNAILKECQDLTLKQINELYPGTNKLVINITENILQCFFSNFVTLNIRKIVIRIRMRVFYEWVDATF